MVLRTISPWRARATRAYRRAANGVGGLVARGGAQCLRAMPMIALAGATLALVHDASGCPTCKEALATSGNSVNLVRGFGWSIIFMLSVPFLTLAGLGSYFYLLVRQARSSGARGHGELPLGCPSAAPVGR